MQFRKDDNTCGCIRNLAWAWGDVTKECGNGSPTTSEGSPGTGRWQKSAGAVVEVPGGFYRDVDEGDTEELLGGS